MRGLSCRWVDGSGTLRRCTRKANRLCVHEHCHLIAIYVCIAEVTYQVENSGILWATSTSSLTLSMICRKSVLRFCFKETVHQFFRRLLIASASSLAFSRSARSTPTRIFEAFQSCTTFTTFFVKQNGKVTIARSCAQVHVPKKARLVGELSHCIRYNATKKSSFPAQKAKSVIWEVCESVGGSCVVLTHRVVIHR